MYHGWQSWHADGGWGWGRGMITHGWETRPTDGGRGWGMISHGWQEEEKREICVYEYVYEYGKSIRTGSPLLLHVLLHSDLLTHVRRARYRRWGMGKGE